LIGQAYWSVLQAQQLQLVQLSVNEKAGQAFLTTTAVGSNSKCRDIVAGVDSWYCHVLNQKNLSLPT